MKYDFDTIIDRKGTDSVKYDLLKQLYGNDDILPMWVADMDFEVPDFIRNALKERMEHPVYGYTFRGEGFSGSVAAWMSRRHGWEISPSSVDFSPGIVPALVLSVLGFTDPGDRVLVQPPVYFPFFSAVETQGRQLVHNQLMEIDGRYTMDFDDLEKKFIEGIKLMMFCHPHNPVGRAWSREELQRLAELCVKYDVKVLSDEIHSDLLLFGHKHIPLASLGKEIAERTITFVAPSKTFNLAGFHTSAVIIENTDLKKKYSKVLEGIHIGGGNIFGAVALEAGYNGGDEWLAQLLTYLEKNFSYLDSFIQTKIPAIKISPLEATYLVWMDCRELQLSDKELMDFMVGEAKLGLLDGPRFGPGGASFMRMNIACSFKVLEKALDQLNTAFINRF